MSKWWKKDVRLGSRRYFYCVFVPPLLGSILLGFAILTTTVIESSFDANFLDGQSALYYVLGYVGFSLFMLFYTFIPSNICFVILKHLFNHYNYVRSNRGVFAICGASLGMISGLLLGILLFGYSEIDFLIRISVILCLVGAVVGYVLAMIWWSLEER